MKKYIVIKRYQNGVIVKKIDVTNRSDRAIEKIENGMNINLDHKNYYTQVIEVES